MFVASTTFCRPCGSGRNAAFCSAGDSAPNSGSTDKLHLLATLSNAAAARRISSAPGRNASTSPAPASTARPTAAATRGGRGAASSGSYATATGNVRPGTRTTGASPRYAATGPASSVADMTTTMRSGRTVCCTSRSRAMATSV
jgi:hypothetical protein